MGRSTAAMGWIQVRCRTNGGRGAECSWPPLAAVGQWVGGGLVPAELGRRLVLEEPGKLGLQFFPPAGCLLILPKLS